MAPAIKADLQERGKVSASLDAEVSIYSNTLFLRAYRLEV